MQDSPALTYSSSHNDVLHFLATGGLLDFACLLMMYGGPLVFFMRVLRHGEATQATGSAATAAQSADQTPALMGLVLVMCFIAFGLTDVMFWLMLPKVFYVMMLGVLTGYCMVAKELHD